MVGKDSTDQIQVESMHERLRSLLVAARTSAGLTQAQVAERLQRPQSFVSKYERGERQLDVVEFIQVAAALGIDAARLLAELAASASRTQRARRK